MPFLIKKGAKLYRLRGDSVTGGSTSGRAFRSIPTEKQGNWILVSQQLDIQIIKRAIEGGASGIIAQEGGISCHGANFLRSWNILSGSSIIGIIVRSREIESIPDGTEIHLNEDGLVIINSDFSTSFSIGKLSSNREYITRKKGQIWRCYWLHRKYSLLEFSLMEPGLRKSLKSLYNWDNKIESDSEGRIWFCEAPSIEEIALIAKDPISCNHHLNRQIKIYDKIINRLEKIDKEWDKYSTKQALSELFDMLDEYFSVFFLLHNTYELVFEHILNRAKEFLPENDALKCLRKSFLSYSVNDFVLNSVFPYNKKKIVTEELIYPLIKESVQEEVKRAISHVKSELKGSCNPELIELYLHVTSIFVVKERKFLLNKQIYTRISYQLKKVMKIKKISEEQLLEIPRNKLLLELA